MTNLVQVRLSDLVVEQQGGSTWYAHLRNQPALIKGCPMGRAETMGRAINDLVHRIAQESHVTVGWIDD